MPGELQWQTSGAPHHLHMAPAAKQPLPSGVEKKEGLVRRRKDPFVGSPSPEQATPAGLLLPPLLPPRYSPPLPLPLRPPPPGGPAPTLSNAELLQQSTSLPSQANSVHAQTSLLLCQTAHVGLSMVQQECVTKHGMLRHCQLCIIFYSQVDFNSNG